MLQNKTLAAILTATTVLTAGAALAADQAMKPADQMKPAHQTALEKDAGKLSVDGSHAYNDLALARLAIFDGRVKDAKTFVDEADAAFDKAKGDDSVFMKAEADFKSLGGAMDKAGAGDKQGDSKTAGNDPDSANAAKQETSAKTYDMTMPKRWLPVDADMSIDEDYTANPTKAAAVADANKSLAKGDKQGAMGKLKLADVDMTYVMAVVPLDQTLADVHQAAQLIDGGKYYEGSQILRQIEASTRYDVMTADTMPGKAPTKAPADKSAEPMTH